MLYFYETWIKALYAVSNADTVIEKTPHYIKYWKEIVSSFPSSKFIVSYRNPYDWLLSYKYKYLTAVSTNTKTIKVIKNQFNIIGCCLNYRSYIKSIISMTNSRPESCILICNDELRLDPVNIHHKINSFLGHKNLNETVQLPKQDTNTSFIKKDCYKLTGLEIFIVSCMCFPREWKILSSYKKRSLSYSFLYYPGFIYELLMFIPYSLKTVVLLSSKNSWPSPIKTIKYLIKSAFG